MRFRHADPALARELKAQVVAEQLHRIAGLDVAVTVQELPGGPLGWRSRTRLAAGRQVATAHDLAAYRQGGYRLLALRVLDAFPMTRHVECVAALTR